MHQERFGFDISKNFSSERMVMHWNRKVVELLVFEEGVGVVVRDMVWWAILVVGGRLD